MPMKRLALCAMFLFASLSLTGCQPDAAVRSGAVVGAGPSTSRQEPDKDTDTPAVPEPSPAPDAAGAPHK